jgi:hypothetical protein
MSDTLYVTPAQVLAAKLAVELSEEAGEVPDEALKAIANAQVEADEQSAADTQGGEVAEPADPEEAGRLLLSVTNDTERTLANWYITLDQDDATFDVLLAPWGDHPELPEARRQARERHESSSSSHEAAAVKRQFADVDVWQIKVHKRTPKKEEGTPTADESPGLPN